jgi:hypothetical protein
MAVYIMSNIQKPTLWPWQVGTWASRGRRSGRGRCTSWTSAEPTPSAWRWGGAHGYASGKPPRTSRTGRRTTGFNVMIAIFCDFQIFSSKKLALFFKANVVFAIFGDFKIFSSEKIGAFLESQCYVRYFRWFSNIFWGKLGVFHIGKAMSWSVFFIIFINFLCKNWRFL